MRYIIVVALYLLASACYVKVDKGEPSKYYDKKTFKLFQQALEYFEKKDFKKSDSLLTIVINNSNDRLSTQMPKSLNPYYFRGEIYYQLNDDKRTIEDFEHVASDTTTDTDVLLVRVECFRMLKRYDTSIVLCNRLLQLHFDTAMVLSERGVDYYQKGDLVNACKDLRLSRQMNPGKTGFLESYLKKCK